MGKNAENGLRHLITRAWRRLMWAGMRGANRHGSDFVTFHTRPKRAEDFGTWSDVRFDPRDAAIVMQGPIATDSDFTLETLKLYRRHFAECRLVLSTWEDTPDGLLSRIRPLGVDVVLGPKPASPGLFNVNMQIASASRGVQHAVKAGARWLMKTRTDQRLCEPNALAYLVAVATAFPVRQGFAQKHRIIGVGHGSLKYAPYHLTDQTVFGHADDMLLYWTPPLRGQPPPSHWPTNLREIFDRVPIGELCRHGAAESYLASTYLQRIGRALDWTLEDSWRAWKDHLCVVDHVATGFYWLKAQQQTFRELLVEYDRVSTRRELDFREWLLLYSGFTPPAAARAHESAMGTPFPTTVAEPRVASPLPPVT